MHREVLAKFMAPASLKNKLKYVLTTARISRFTRLNLLNFVSAHDLIEFLFRLVSLCTIYVLIYRFG